MARYLVDTCRVDDDGSVYVKIGTEMVRAELHGKKVRPFVLADREVVLLAYKRNQSDIIIVTATPRKVNFYTNMIRGEFKFSLDFAFNVKKPNKIHSLKFEKKDYFFLFNSKNAYVVVLDGKRWDLKRYKEPDFRSLILTHYPKMKDLPAIKPIIFPSSSAGIATDW